MSIAGESYWSGRAAIVLPDPLPPARSGAWRAVLSVLLVLAVGDVVAVHTVGPGPAEAVTSAVTVGSAGGPTEVLVPAQSAATATAGPAGAPSPVALAIPSLGLRTALVDLTLAPDSTLAAPDDAAIAGWWSQGTAPGEVGPAVIVGHVDSMTGPGVFIRIHELRAGEPITVTRNDGKKVTFVVDEVQQYPKSELPTALVYGPSSKPELRLITCGGRFDKRKGSYEANVVVFAHQEDSIPAGRPA